MTLFSYQFSPFAFIMICLVAVFIGMAKTGIHGAGTMAVPLLALVFGGQNSSGLMLPMLCLADTLGVWYYHRHASWSHLKKLFPWAVVGTVLGTWVGGYIDDHVFKLIMAGVIIASVLLMLWLRREENKEEIPDYYWFAALMGVVGGFTSMVGNVAGSTMAVYFLAMRLPKNTYIGTAAWFFLVINWFKVPFHVFAWHTITLDSFLLGLVMLPAIILGAFAGIQLVKIMPEKIYRAFVVGMTLLAAAMMFIKG